MGMRSNFYERDEPGALSATEEALQRATDEDAPPEKRYGSGMMTGRPENIVDRNRHWIGFLDDQALIAGFSGTCKNGCRFRCRCAQ
jgi:hypothetical protein